MNCRQVKLLYTAFRDKDLDKDSEREVLEHIKGCDSCRILYSTLDVVTSFAGQYEEIKPASRVIDGILKRIETQRGKARFLKPSFVIIYGTLLFFIVIISLGIFHRVSVKRQLIARKKQEEMIKNRNRYIMDYGHFDKGRVVYTVQDNGYSVKVIETSY